MAGCPYTWFKGIFGATTSSSGEASNLRVKVVRNLETTVDVSLPARSARWLIDVIPDDVVTRIRAEGIPIDDIQGDLAKTEVLVPRQIFTLNEDQRMVQVWLE